MITVISLEADPNITFHIIQWASLDQPRTIKVGGICSPKEVSYIRELLETNNIRDLVFYFKGKFSLTHTKITISLGQEIRRWLYRKNKGDKFYEI